MNLQLPISNLQLSIINYQPYCSTIRLRKRLLKPEDRKRAKKQAAAE